MKVSIASTMTFAGRVMALVDVEMNGEPYRTLFYKSSGTNVDGRDLWFPSSGVSGPGEFRSFPGGEDGIITKDLLIGQGGSINLVTSRISTKEEHAQPQLRLNTFSYSDKVPFNVEELSAAVAMEYSSGTYPPVENIAGNDEGKYGMINVWARGGLEATVPKSKTNNGPKIKKRSLDEEFCASSPQIRR